MAPGDLRRVIPVTGRTVLEQVAWLLPTRWGFAAAASTVDLVAIAPCTGRRYAVVAFAPWWLFDIAMLIALGVVLALGSCAGASA